LDSSGAWDDDSEEGDLFKVTGCGEEDHAVGSDAGESSHGQTMAETSSGFM
jgi:hypothetical protein